jgi:hypothetical protein
MEVNNIQESIIDNQSEDNNDEGGSRLNEIIEHIQKPKKLVLPKGYLRPRNTQVDFLDIQDNLSVEPVSNNSIKTDKKETEVKPLQVNILEPSEDVKNDAKKKNKKSKDNQEKKTRNPTAYNIFVKQTVVQLTETHKHLTAKERFKLAIAMWSENKPNKTK